MANVAPDASGTGLRLYFRWHDQEGKTLKHGLRFKVVVEKDRWATVNLNNMQCPVALDSKTWDKVIEFVTLNKDLIRWFWNKEIEDPEFHSNLVKLK